MKRFAYIAGLLGLAVTIGLIARQGAASMAAALAAAGAGLVAVALFHLLPMTLDTLAWRALLRGAERPSFTALLGIRWIREAVDGLLPVAQVGGELVAVRLLRLRGIDGARAAAGLVVDVTLAVVTQLLFALLGLGLLWSTVGDDGLVGPLLVGLLIAAAAVSVFFLLQHRGLFTPFARRLPEGFGGRRWLALAGGAVRLDAAIRAFYRRRWALLCCAVWQLGGWLAGAGEVWLALYFLGQPVSWLEALLLESLGQAVRSAAFAVPASLGVQEGGYMILAGVLGLDPALGLALSLIKRVRELLLGLPALLVWQMREGRRLWAATRARVQP